MVSTLKVNMALNGLKAFCGGETNSYRTGEPPRTVRMQRSRQKNCDVSTSLSRNGPGQQTQTTFMYPAVLYVCKNRCRTIINSNSNTRLAMQLEAICNSFKKRIMDKYGLYINTLTVEHKNKDQPMLY